MIASSVCMGATSSSSGAGDVATTATDSCELCSATTAAGCAECGASCATGCATDCATDCVTGAVGIGADTSNSCVATGLDFCVGDDAFARALRIAMDDSELFSF